ncbi:peptide chain release factor N(5)-glutamine methyltransferase [Nesterenkonia pannonica]|uniref:N5-glutamine methyltransferase family protein n=1 Tax=Nesterenkonia pannonica TaxID=1548602 RepID=UPI002164E838|nr:HemK/PrmC family methyltransferase [Nesterenkonia pannonica]
MVGLELDHGSVGEFQRLIEERARRVPLQHLTGSAPFRTLELRVGPGVFVPRPETEAVVDVALAEIDRLLGLGVAVPRIVDLGTGAGTIAASIAAERPQCDVHAIEVSEAAAAWAALNFSRLPQHAAQVRLHVQDLRDFEQDGFDVVVSNPPYIPPSMVPTEPEVHEHDPRTALYGGERTASRCPAR